ncbi:TPA: Histone-lysine N-methyltransferase, H3 lysine-36 and H4 lysine-20 specific [Trebouxia sp. C0004]
MVPAAASEAAQHAKSGDSRQKQTRAESDEAVVQAQLQQDCSQGRPQQTDLPCHLSEEQWLSVKETVQNVKVLLELVRAGLEQTLSTLKQAEHEQKIVWIAAYELLRQFYLLDKFQHCKKRSKGLLWLLRNMAAVDNLDQQFRLKWPLQPIFLEINAQRSLNLDKSFLPPVLQLHADNSTASTGKHAAPAAAAEEAVTEAAGTHSACAAAVAANVELPLMHRAAEGVNEQQAGSNGQHAGSNSQPSENSEQHHQHLRQEASGSAQQAGSSGQQAGMNEQQTQDSGQQADSSRQQGRKKEEQTGHSRQRQGCSGKQPRNSGQQAEAGGQQTGNSGQQGKSDGQQAGPSSIAASVPTSVDGAAVPMAGIQQNSATPAVPAKSACLTPYRAAMSAAREAEPEGAAAAVSTAVPTSGNTAPNGTFMAAIAPPQVSVDNTVDGDVDSTLGEVVEDYSQLADDEATFRAVTGTECIAYGAARYEAAIAEVLTQEDACAEVVARSVKLAVGIAAARAVVVAGIRVVYQDTEAVLEKAQALVKLCQVNINKAHNSTPIAGKLALIECIAALHLEQRAVYLYRDGHVQEEQREHLGSISKLQHMLCGLAERLETVLPSLPIPVGGTAQAMLDGTARRADLLPVTDWAVLFCSPVVSPATFMPGSHVITSSAATSAARSGTPTAAPAAPEAACQAAAASADSEAALPGPLSVAQSARSAESEDIDEHREGLEWLFAPSQPQQQAAATIRCAQHEDQERQHQAAGWAVPVSAGDEAVVVAPWSTAQPATHAVVPQALLDLAVQSGEVKNQPPQFQHILTSVYARGVAKPKRRPDDKVPSCNCQSRFAGAELFSATVIGQVARRQSARHLGLEAAAAASSAAASTACLPSKSDDVPPVDLADGSDFQCEVSDLDLHQAILNVDRIVSCLSMEEPEGNSSPFQQSLLPSIPIGTGWASSLSQSKWHQNAAAQQQAGCGDKCLNRQLCVLCDAKLCPCGTDCSNRSFEELKSPLVEAFLTPNRGWGVKAAQLLRDGSFIVEYVGAFIMLPAHHGKVPIGILLDIKAALECLR